MRPLVEKAQQLPPGTSQDRRAEDLRRGAGAEVGTKIAASSAVKSLAPRLTSGPEPGRELPRFAESGTDRGPVGAG